MKKKVTLLIVEDEISLRHALKLKLTKEGFNVLEAANGQIGLAMALTEHPDLILLDIIMPVMDGMTMLSKLREDQWGCDAGVIILTNLSDTAKSQQALAKQSYDYLIKANWKIEDLVKKIREYLKKHQK